MALRCPKCSKEIRGGAKFCNKCGYRIIGKAMPIKEQHSFKPSSTVGVSKTIFYSSTILFVVLIIILVFAYINATNEIKNLDEQLGSQRAETYKYRNLYSQEATTSQQERTARQTAESTASQLGTQLTSEQRRAAELTRELSSTESKLSQAQTQLESVKGEVQETINTLSNLERWISSNAELSSYKLSSIHNLCGNFIDYKDNTCIIKADMMGQAMKTCLKFTWVDDKITTNFGAGDRIFDIETFWASRKGDCDDFALFHSAWLRSEYETAKSICSPSNIYIRLDNPLSSAPKYVRCPCDIYPICGVITKWGGGGHCETGVSTSSYNPSDGTTFYNQLSIIEPQTGEYDGVATQIFSSIWDLFTKNDFLELKNYQIVRSIQRSKSKLQGINTG